MLKNYYIDLDAFKKTENATITNQCVAKTYCLPNNNVVTVYFSHLTLKGKTYGQISEMYVRQPDRPYRREFINLYRKDTEPYRASVHYGDLPDVTTPHA